jgi:hypothetical protein
LPNKIGAFGSGKLASYAAVNIARTAVLPKLLLAREYVPLHDPSVQS